MVDFKGGGVERGAAGAKRRADEAALPDRIADLLAEINRVLGTAPEPGLEAGLDAEIERLMQGFDERLAVVNRRLDRVLERRA